MPITPMEYESTTVSLRDHVERMFADLKTLLERAQIDHALLNDARFKSIEESTTKAAGMDLKTTTTDERLNVVTATQQTVKMSLAEHDKRLAVLEKAQPFLHGIAYVGTAVLVALLIALATGKMHLGVNP